MDPRGADKMDELDSAETPEDVAVLYSWANLHGAKYRDFSASRREYRAQLRHRAAEQVREQALLAQAEAEEAAKAAESAARKAAEAAQGPNSDSSMQRSLREAEEAARTAAAERVEAARRAEAAAVAEAAARREEREIAEAHASAQRQAARYAESEIRRREMTGSQGYSQVPGHISDPYTPQPQASVAPPPQPAAPPPIPSPLEPISQTPPVSPIPPPPRSEMNTSYAPPLKPAESVPVLPPVALPRSEYTSPASQVSQRRPLGYSPDEASGVRQIYRGPEFEMPKAIDPHVESVRRTIHSLSRASFVPPPAITGSSSASVPSPATRPLPEQPLSSQRSASSSEVPNVVAGGKRHTDPKPSPWTRAPQPDSGERSVGWPSVEQPLAGFDSGFGSRRDLSLDVEPENIPTPRPVAPARPSTPSGSVRPVSPFSQPPVLPETSRGRRAQDDFGYPPVSSYSDPPQRTSEPLPGSSTISSAQRAAYGGESSGPAWLYAPPASSAPAKPAVPAPLPPQSSVAETLQHSRERVAARWYALKGVFEQPGQEQPEPAPVRQKETRTPVLAVFSLAGGVGKTSLIATVGRSLSSLGEKVLLTDTTSHGLLPFYFGASELRQGTVRTFSPPSGSTDAPIYLVSYDVDQKIGDEAAQDHLIEEIINNSRGTHRILLDLTPNSGWIVRHMARMNPTILVPLAPDMNSVISLQSIEKFFHGAVDADGRQLQPYYLLNQFDASLPLHLDVREVLRRQLGERLLPFVIRRAPAVSEALAEGMTVVDYAPESPVSEDYLNIATWLRTIAAPATAGFRNVRWSER